MAKLLAELTREQDREGTFIQMARVRSVSGDRVQVLLPGGQEVFIPYLSSYSPQTGDRALLVISGGRVVALGSLA